MWTEGERIDVSPIDGIMKNDGTFSGESARLGLLLTDELLGLSAESSAAAEVRPDLSVP